MSERVMTQADAEGVAAALRALNEGLLRGLVGSVNVDAWPTQLQVRSVQVEGVDGTPLGAFHFYSHESINEWRFAPNGYVAPNAVTP